MFICRYPSALLVKQVISLSQRPYKSADLFIFLSGLQQPQTRNERSLRYAHLQIVFEMLVFFSEVAVREEFEQICLHSLQNALQIYD